MSLHLSPPATLVADLRAAGCVYAEDEAALLLAEAATAAHLAAMVRRRTSGEPLEHVLGWAAFCGLRVGVTPGVFVPRRRTEALARVACSVASRRPRPVVIDLCTGAGAIAAAVLAALPDAILHATDLDPTAIRCVRRNLAGTPARIHEGDLFTALPAQLRHRVDVVIANAPYVPSAEIALLPSEARLHEHRVALDGGADGLAVHRRIAAEAPRWLCRGGQLLIETSEAQADGTAAAMQRHGLATAVVRDRELDAVTVVGTLGDT